MVENKLRLVALISGGGSTMFTIGQATKEHTKYGYLPRTELVGVISSNPQAKGLERAKQLGLSEDQIFCINLNSYPSPEVYGEALLSAFKQLKPDVIGQYGYEPLTPKNAIEGYDQAVWINQHPGPIDPSNYDFGGRGMSCATRVHAARLMFVRETQRNFWTDVVSQRVGVGFDSGRVFRRGHVPIYPCDTVQTLADRAIKVEWQVQINTLKDIEEGTLKEQPPYRDLILPGERMLLHLVKQIAIRTYDRRGEQILNPRYCDLLGPVGERASWEITRLLSHLDLGEQQQTTKDGFPKQNLASKDAKVLTELLKTGFQPVYSPDFYGSEEGARLFQTLL